MSALIPPPPAVATPPRRRRGRTPAASRAAGSPRRAVARAAHARPVGRRARDARRLPPWPGAVVTAPSPRAPRARRSARRTVPSPCPLSPHSCVERYLSERHVPCAAAMACHTERKTRRPRRLVRAARAGATRVSGAHLLARLRDHRAQLLAGLEDRHGARGDFDRISGARIARHPGFPLADLEGPESAT